MMKTNSGGAEDVMMYYKRCGEIDFPEMMEVIIRNHRQNLGSTRGYERGSFGRGPPRHDG